MRRIDKNRNMWKKWMNNRNNMFLISPPYWRSRKIEKWLLICFDECWKYFLMYPFLYGEYHLFSQNIESSLEQLNSFPAFLQKANNSIATKLCVNLLHTCATFLKQNGAQHNSITKLCYAFLNMKINWKVIDKSNAQFWSAFKWESV